ncbi:MAG TPA: YfhO family protein, partial [Vicinamibacteria bacterium]|nr:YfhO family protein [Vicinamibacteria bacterium]
FQRDIHSYWYPHIEVFVRAVAEGSWPLWNPYVGFGTPLLADPNFQLAYPPTWLNLVLPPAVYYKAFVIVHCWMAGVGLFLLSRRLGLSTPAALLAGAAWCASGPLLSAASLFHHFAGAAWIPWVLWGLEGVLQGGAGASALLLGSLAAGQVLAGSGDMCLITTLSGVLRLCAHFVRASPDWPEVRRLGAAGAGAALVAAGLSAVQWLPTAELLSGSARLGQTPATSTHWSVHPLSLLDLLFPSLVADFPMSVSLRAVLFDSREPLLASLYLGLPAGMLVVLGVAAGRRPRALAAIACVLFILAALGLHTPFYGWLLRLPLVRLLRFPTKYMIPAALFWALLAGTGFEVWRTAWTSTGRRLAVVLGAAMAALALGSAMVAAGWRSAAGMLEPFVFSDPAPLAARLAATASTLWWSSALAWACALLLWLRARRETPSAWMAIAPALLVLDLVIAGRQVNPLAPPELLSHRPPLLDALGREPVECRLYSMGLSGPWLEAVRGPEGWKRSWSRALGAQERLQAPMGARWRLFGSYDGDFTGLATVAFGHATALMRANEDTPLGLKLLQMANVCHVVSARPGGPPGATTVAEQPSVFPAPIRLLRVPDPLPRAYVVSGVRRARDDAAIGTLVDPAFDATREVVLAPAEGATDVQDSPEFRATARILWRRSNALAVAVDAAAPGYLVVVESYHPGWKAFVDGEETVVLRANALFRAVPIRPGRHQVVFEYRSPAAFRGALSTLLTGATMLGLVAWRRRRPTAPR